MRSGLCAGLVAGSVILHAAAAFAGEGSSLRGLKPPRDVLNAVSASEAPDNEGLKWRAVEVASPLAPRLSLYGGALDTQRFGASEQAFGLYRAFGQSPSLLAEGNASPLYDGLPKYTLFNQVTQELPGGWGLGFGIRQGEFNFATSNLLAFSAERYVGNFRGAFTLYSSRADGSPLASAHRFQLNYFYGERNTVGLAYTAGRDIDHLGLGGALPVNDVRDLTLSGRHWLSLNWALTYDVLSQEQALNRRQGMRLGVTRSF